MLVSIGLGGFGARTYAEEPAEGELKVNFSEVIDLSESGVEGITGHGGHQTRVVHTSHGDYAAYQTDAVTGNGKEMSIFNVVRVDDNGDTEVVMTGYKAYDSSHVGVIADSEENVWAVVVGGNSFKDQFDGREETLVARAYKYDAETGMVTYYDTSVERRTTGGYGYSSFCYDEVNQRIYTVTSTGDQPGELVWMVFSLETLTWEGKAHAIETDARYCYPFIYADGKGGMMILCERDIRCAALGYPEVGNNNGLNEFDLMTFERWSADYCWDQLKLYYIEDVYKDEAHEYMVAEADYSKVTGDQDYRYSLEGRKNNLYPAFSNNLGGDVYLDKDGYLHIIYLKGYTRAAYDRVFEIDQWYHSIYDVSDPANIKLLSEVKLADDGVGDAEGTTAKTAYLDHSYHIYQDSKGQLYYIASEMWHGECENSGEGEIIVYALSGDVNNGYEAVPVARQAATGSSILNVASNRANTLEDDKIAVIWNKVNSEDWQYIQIELAYEAEQPDPTPAPTGEPTPAPTDEPTEPGAGDIDPVILYVGIGVAVVVIAGVVVGVVLGKKKKKA